MCLYQNKDLITETRGLEVQSTIYEEAIGQLAKISLCDSGAAYHITQKSFQK